MRAILAAVVSLLMAGSAFAACANPNAPGGTSPEGVIIYNSDYRTMQFCGGTTWWDMKGGVGGAPSCAAGDGLVMTSAGWGCSPGGPP